MKTLHNIKQYEPLKLLGDPRRLVILQSLMAEAATLSQLGKGMEMHPAQVRHHLKRLEQAGLVELISTRIVGGFVEKYYRATAQAYLINLTIVPKRPFTPTILTLGSHDMALELLAQQLQQQDNTPDMFALPVGSLDGLIALRQGVCQLAGCHLFDVENGRYNQSYVRHLFPGQPMSLITLAHRQQGLLVAPGNPLQIQAIADLIREDVTFINRKQGSGTRLWLDQQLKQLGVVAAQIKGYEREVNTHLQVAQAVVQGKADVGLGVLAAAQPAGLGFIPLFEERFDLVMAGAELANPLLQPVLDHLQTAEFRRTINSLGGYDSAHTGEEIKMGA